MNSPTSLVANTAEEKHTTALGATTEAQEPEKPLTGYPADRDALNQAYCVSSAKRNAQEVHDAFLKGVEWEKRRACNSFDALTEANARYRRALEQVLISVGHGDAKDIAQRALKSTGAK